MPRTIVFDEAGNTGDDLLNAAQPVFTLASVDVSIEAAMELVETTAEELHFRTARRSAQGRQAVLRVLADQRLSSSTVRTFAVHKQFLIVAKMVDLLVEPLAVRHGYDLYAEGAHLAMSNLLFAVLPVFAGPGASARLNATFVDMCRDPTAARTAAFHEAIDAAARAAGGRLDGELQLLAVGARLRAFGEGSVPDLDPAPPCLVALAHSWASDGDSLAIIHDSRPELRRWEPALAIFWRANAEPATFVRHDGLAVTFPIPVRGFATAASHDDPRIQVADVIAGALQLVLNDLLGAASDPVFASRLRSDTDTLNWVVDAIWPTRDVDPTALGTRSGATPSFADAITAWSVREKQ